MKRRSNGARAFSAQSVLPEVTFSTITVKRRRGSRLKSNITVPQDAVMVTSSDWDSMPEVDNTWTLNLDPTELETLHVVHSKRQGGKVSVLQLAS
jgi:hypothetical protein